VSISFRSQRLVLLTLTATIALLLAANGDSAQAASFTVNSTADTTECAATCTLRGAIAAADESLDASSTVLVQAGTYVLGPAEKSNPSATGELRIATSSGKTLTIAGAGVGSTVIDAGQHPNGENDRVMQVSGGGKDILEGLTIQKGFQHEDEAFSEEDVRGAGILQIGGELTLSHVRVTANKNNGWGGGIDVRGSGKLIVENSEVDHDWTSVGGGGGVALEPGTMIATNTTFDNDTSASGEGGGVQVMPDATATLTNVTIADDGYVEGGLTYEGGGLYVGTGGTVHMTNVTFAGDLAGGAFAGGSDISAEEPSHLTFKNVLLGERPEEEPGENDCNGEEVGSSVGWLDEGGNLAADTSCGFEAAHMSQDMKFGELGMYGGATPTIPLLEGSPAIDFGVSGCPTTDQREYARVGICDSGAFEFGATPPASGSGTPGGTSTSPPPTGTIAGTSPTSSPAPNVASTPKAIEEVLLGCSKHALALNDVLIGGGHVILNGSAAKSLIGKKVKILFDGKTQVASATVKADGEFSTTAPLPPTRLRNSNSARYIAASGAQRSLNLKLTRRLILQQPTFAGGNVTLTGQVVGPLTKPVGTVTVEQQLECGKNTKVLAFTPSASGRFHVTIKGIPANAKAGLYRLTTSVLGSPHSHHAFHTYSLPLPVPLG
jgi:CSLREA domain-containing protein